jgi:ribonucleoside-diphosphate reductase alpha chain
MRFEPAGYTKNPEIPIAKSLVDYIFRYLASRFLTADLRAKAGVISRDDNGNGNGVWSAPAVVELPARAVTASASSTNLAFENSADAPSCHQCGHLMVRNGACYKCLNCGETSGCS